MEVSKESIIEDLLRKKFENLKGGSCGYDTCSWDACCSDGDTDACSANTCYTDIVST